MSSLRSRLLLLIATSLSALALGTTSASAGWSTANAGSWSAGLASGTTMNLAISSSLGSRTANCATASMLGQVFVRTNASYVNVASVNLYGGGCQQSGTPVAFSCTGASYNAWSFQTMGGVSPTWAGSRTQGIAYGLDCTYAIGACTATVVDAPVSVNWNNATATGPAVSEMGGGPGASQVNYTTNGSLACVTHGLANSGTITYTGSSALLMKFSLYSPSNATIQPRIWEQ